MAAVAQVTTYQELQDHVADLLIRSDLTTPMTTFIQMAEQRLNRDERVKKLVNRGDFTVSADGTAMPSDILSIESWYHDGPTYRGPIEITSADNLGHLKRLYGDTGAPAFAAIIAGTALYAPEPDGTYTTKLVYWRKVDALSASNTSNWLLADHADIYVYATLAEAAPYLKDDNRVPLWENILQQRLEALHLTTQNEQFSGTMRRQFRPIG